MTAEGQQRRPRLIAAQLYRLVAIAPSPNERPLLGDRIRAVCRSPETFHLFMLLNLRGYFPGQEFVAELLDPTGKTLVPVVARAEGEQHDPTHEWEVGFPISFIPSHLGFHRVSASVDGSPLVALDLPVVEEPPS